MHSYFRIGGLKPGETKAIRGKIYLMPADLTALHALDRRDFPGQERTPAARHGTGRKETDRALAGTSRYDLSAARARTARANIVRLGVRVHLTSNGAGGVPENSTWLCWGRWRLSQSELEPAIADLVAIKSARFHHNFLRSNVTPADIDWFEDHAAEPGNRPPGVRSRARAGGCPGLLDTEAYQRSSLTTTGSAMRTVGPGPNTPRRQGKSVAELRTRFKKSFPN